MEQKHYGIYRATVVDNRDPEKLRRLKVSIPQITGHGRDKKTGWIWPVLPSARPPAISSGVWVAYIGGNPEYPVWVGEFNKTFQGVFCFGSFMRVTSQTTTINTPTPVTFDTTAVSSGVKLQAGTKLVVEQSGTYNIQFSAQIHHAGGGGAGETLVIWVKKNGQNISDSATTIVTKSNVYTVMTVNVYETMKSGDYFEIYWRNDNASLHLEAVSAFDSVPNTPAIIATVNQVA